MPKLKQSILPWLCFSTNIPTATISSRPSSTVSLTTVKLIMCNGQVKIFHHSVPASDIMSEFPSHLLCHSDSFLIGQKVPALEASDMLEIGQSYFLLPSKFFHSELSLVSIASSFSPSDRAALLRMVEVQRTPSGKLRIRVSDEFMDKVDRGGRGRVCTTAALEKEYKGMVKKRGEGWRPKLETIKESKERRKDRKGNGSRKLRDKVNSPKNRPPPPLSSPTKKSTKSKPKDKENIGTDGNISQLEDQEHDCHSTPPSTSPKALKSKDKEKSKKEKDKDKEKGDEKIASQDKEKKKKKKEKQKMTKGKSEEKNQLQDNDEVSSSPPPPQPETPSMTSEAMIDDKKRKKEKKKEEKEKKKEEKEKKKKRKNEKES